MSLTHAWCNIVPPHILSSIAEKGTARQRELARRSIEASDRHRAGRRAIVEGRTAATRVQAVGKSRVVFDGRTIAGTVLMPFLTRNAEGFDVNKPYDWDLAEHMLKNNTARLLSISRPPYRKG